MNVVRLIRNRKGLLVRLGGGGTFLLDQYSGAAAAYSLRKLSSNYLGSAIRVRRSLDNTELDIGFNEDGTLDIFSLISFTGTGDGFVVTWYDQSGNGNNTTQAITGNQPQTVSAGVIVEVNNEPSVDFGVNSGITGLPTGSEIPIGSVFTVYKVDVFTNINIILGTYQPDGDIFTTAFAAGGNNVGYNGLSTLYHPNIETLGLGENLNQHIGTYTYDSVNSFLSLDGSPLTNVGTNELSFRVLGNIRNFGTNSLSGKLQEVIIYPSDQSANKSAIELNINSHYQIYWDGSKTGFLDTYPDAAAAYSLRNLSSSYTGPLVRVRRSSDNDEQDIYGTYNGELNTTVLLNFVGAGDGFVVTRYDQSGNGYDLSQAVTTKQPKIVNSGALYEFNGKPYILFNGTVDFLVSNSSSTFGSDSRSCFTVQKPNVIGVDAIFSLSDSGLTGGTWILTPEVATRTNSVTWVSSTPASLINPSLISNIYTTGDLFAGNSMWLDGTEVVRTSGINGSINTEQLNMLEGAARTTGSNAFDGFTSEILIYDSDQSANKVGIESNINSYYKIYWDGSSSGILDTYSGASAAYSLRALSSSYTGPIIKVRRASDNAEIDIYANYAGDLDTTSLEDFCSATDGFITTFYDQSGNANDATQSTDAKQLSIVESGVLVTNLENGLPAARLSAIGAFMDFTSVQAKNVFSVARMEGLSTINYLLYNSTSEGFFYGGSLAGVDGLGATLSGSVVSITGENFNTKLANFYNDGDDYNVSDNGGALNFLKTSPIISASEIGRNQSATAINFNGLIQEIIIYSTGDDSNNEAIKSNINSYYNIYWDGSQEGLLDEHPDASAAYSLRALNSAYVGPAIRVRRSSDNAEKDIKLLYDGTLDEEGLLDFVGANNGFVVTWYDQSGNGNDATNATAINQPRIVSLGTLFLENSKPAMEFISNTQQLALTSLITAPEFTSFTVQRRRASGRRGVTLSGGGSFRPTTPLLFQDNLIYINTSDGVNTYFSSTPFDNNNQLLLTGFANSTTQNIWSNSVLVGLGAISSAASGATTFDYIGSYGNSTINALGQEIIFYSGDNTANRVAIESNINNYYTIY